MLINTPEHFAQAAFGRNFGFRQTVRPGCSDAVVDPYGKRTPRPPGPEKARRFFRETGLSAVGEWAKPFHKFDPSPFSISHFFLSVNLRFPFRTGLAKEVTFMRRILTLLLCLSLAVLPVRGAEETKYVALTFDDGPSGKYTRQLLDGLYDRGAKATFLLCGYRLADYPDLAQRILDEGHEIGCHGYSHKDMRQLSRRDIASEIIKTQELLPEKTRTRFLRPPGGCCSQAVRQVAEARNMAILGWSVDPRDWATGDAGAIEKYVLEHIRDGDVVLLHDMSESSVAAALAIADALLEQDVELVTVSELVRIRGVRLRPGEVYSRFPPPS